MKGFSGFKAAPTKFKMNGQDNLKGHSTKKRAKMGRANKMLERLGMEGLKSKDLQPLKDKYQYRDDNLNKAARRSARHSSQHANPSAKEFLRKNTVKPKPQKPLSRPFGPGTRPLARNVSKVLRTASRGFGALGIALGIYEGTKAVFKGYGKMGKTKAGRQIIKSGRMQPGKM